MMIEFQVQVVDTKPETDPDLRHNFTVIKILGYVQFVVSLLSIVLWLFVSGPPTVMTGYRKLFKTYKKELLNDVTRGNKTNFIIGQLSKNYSDISYIHKIEIINYMNERHGVKYALVVPWYYGNMVSMVFHDPMFKFYLFNLCLVLQCIYFETILLYSIMLADFVNYFRQLDTVKGSITRPYKLFLLVFTFFLIINYIYA